MVFDRFAANVTLRVAGLFVTLMLLAATLFGTDFVVTPVLLAGAVALQTWLLLRTVQRTSSEVARFLDAARAGDFTQRFTGGARGGRFEELSSALDQLMARMRDARSRQEQQWREAQALIEQVPSALLMVHEGGRVELLNSAARRLLGHLHGVSLEEWPAAREEADLVDALRHQQPGERRVVKAGRGRQVTRMAVAVSELALPGRRRRIVSLEDIQRVLEATELDAWRTLVRVLTHEIINSVTPISSLANTAAALIDDRSAEAGQAAVGTGDDTLADVRAAVAVVASRCERLMGFVDTYRSLSRVPDPVLEAVPVDRLFDDLARLKRPALNAAGIDLRIDVSPAHLTVEADRRLLEQALINLVTNAIDALTGSPGDAMIRLRGYRETPGSGRVVLAVTDNGPGIDPALREDVFVPFFTTKTTGTGVGLALVKQIQQAHGGSVALVPGERAGTTVELRF